MSIKRALSVCFALGVATLAAAANVQFYDENLPGSLNPLYAESMVDFRAQELYFDRLYFNNPLNNRLTSKISKRWELAGSQGVRLFLNEGLKWHNGEDLTAADICFTIDAIKDPKTTSVRAKEFRKSFKGCTVEKKLHVHPWQLLAGGRADQPWTGVPMPQACQGASAANALRVDSSKSAATSSSPGTTAVSGNPSEKPES